MYFKINLELFYGEEYRKYFKHTLRFLTEIRTFDMRVSKQSDIAFYVYLQHVYKCERY